MTTEQLIQKDKAQAMRIKSLICNQPPRPEEYGFTFTVGVRHDEGVVSNIEPIHWHGLHWFDVFAGPKLVARVNAKHVDIILPGDE